MKAQKNTEQFEAENNMTHAFADLQDDGVSTSEFPRLLAPRRVCQPASLNIWFTLPETIVYFLRCLESQHC